MIEIELKENVGLEIRDGSNFVKTLTYDDTIEYLVLKEMARLNGGKIIFKNINEFILELEKYIGLNAVQFARYYFVNNDPELEKVFTLFSPEPSPVHESCFSIVPNEMVYEVFQETNQISSLLEQRFDVSRLMDISTQKDATVLYPTKFGFVIKKVSVDITESRWYGKYVTIDGKTYYPNDMPLKAILILAQVLKGRKNSILEKLSTTLVNSFPPLFDVINSVANYDTDLETAILLYGIGDLTNVPIVLPIIEPDRVVWKPVTVSKIKVTESAIFMHYRYGNYTGRIALSLGTCVNEYADAIMTFLERNEWLKERIMRNATKLIKLLTKYRDFLEGLTTQIKLFL